MKQKPITDWRPVRVRQDAERREDPFAPRDGLNYCLDCWRDWMHKDDRDLSAGTMRIDYLQDVRHRMTPAELLEAQVAEERRRDMKIGEATGAMIDSLKPLHQWAIYKSVGLSRVWRFDSADYVTVLLLAKLELIEKLKKNVATRFQFE
jgi:hypothetical protein